MEKCIVCSKITDKTIHINEDNGFCQSSQSKYLCDDCYEESKRYIQANLFLVINGNLYHEFNLHLGIGIYRTVDRIYDARQLDYILNKSYYNLLNEMNW
jgi:hypothetical protein